MSIKIPQPQWNIPNNSDKFGSLWYTKNIDFDEEGYARLSERMVRLYSDTDDSDFSFPLAIGRQGQGDYQYLTDENNWGLTIDETNRTFAKDTGSNEPSPTVDGHAEWYLGLWHANTTTKIYSRPATGGASQAWTERITGLTSGKRHKLSVHKNRVEIAVLNGNVVKQYDGNDSYNNTIDLTVPSDYELVDIVYNNGHYGIVSRLANASAVGNDNEAMFFLWDGATTGSTDDASLNSDAGVGVVAYQSSFVVLNRLGQLMYWNGGGFQVIAEFPFYFTDKIWGDAQGTNALGNVFMKAQGGVIDIHIGMQFDAFGVKEERYMPNNPSGMWRYDPKIGLYHRRSLSNSPMYVNFVDGATGINTSTNVFTVSAGVYGAETVPDTGNIARLVTTAGIGGLTLNKDYYIIKEGATTFKLAETKKQALVGDAIDITSATAGSNYFWMFDLQDYGQSYYPYSGAFTYTGDNNAVYKEIIAGARMFDTDLTDIHALCVAVPFLENRGVMVSPKLFSTGEKDTLKSITVRFRPLASTDSIVVSTRMQDKYGLPVSTPSDNATWTGKNDLYTTRDLSEAKTFIDSGGQLEIEIISGVGAGQYVQVESIAEDNGTYSLCLKEEVIGVTAGDKSEFVLANWDEQTTITSADNDDGFVEVGLDVEGSKFGQFKLELRGSNIYIEDIIYNNAVEQDNI